MLDTDAELQRLAGSPVGGQTPNRWAVEEAVPRGLAVLAAFSLRLLLIAAAVALVGFVVSQLLVVVVPVVAAILLTTVLTPAARWLQRRGWPDYLAALLLVLTAVVGIVVALVLIVPQFVSELGDLGQKIEEGARKLAGSLAIEPLGITETQIDRAIDRASQELQTAGPEVLGGVLTGALLVAEIAAAVLLTLALTFFFVKDGERVWAWVESLFGEHRRATVHEMGVRAFDVLSSYVRGVALVATMDALLIGLAIAVLGVPLLFPLVVLTFIAGFFPIIGAVTAGVAAVLVALVANGLPTALALLAVIILVQQLEGNVFYPVVVGPKLAVHPVAILLSLAVGGVIAGLAGAFLAVPLVAVAGRWLEYARERGHAPPSAEDSAAPPGRAEGTPGHPRPQAEALR